MRKEQQNLWDDLWSRHDLQRFYHNDILVILSEGNPKGFFDHLLKWISEDDRSIIEVGCGTGQFCVGLGKYFPKSQITALDSSIKSVEIGKKLASYNEVNNVDFLKRDLFSTGFPDGSFDVAFNEGVIEHFHNYRDAIAEMVRITKAGGKIIVAVPSGECLFTALTLKFLQKDEFKIYGYFRLLKRKELIESFRYFNLEQIEVSGFNPAHSIKRLSRYNQRFIRFGELFDVFVVRPLDLMTNGFISRRFGFEVVIKGIKRTLSNQEIKPNVSAGL